MVVAHRRWEAATGRNRKAETEVADYAFWDSSRITSAGVAPRMVLAGILPRITPAGISPCITPAVIPPRITPAGITPRKITLF